MQPTSYRSVKHRLVLLVASIAIAAVAACDHASRVTAPRPGDPLFSTWDSDECPDPTDCEPATAAQRRALDSVIRANIRWHIPKCAEMGYYMRDFVLNGDVRQFSRDTINDSYWVRGNYTATPIRQERIAFHTRLFAPNWGLQRAAAAIHEGVDSWHQSGSQTTENMAMQMENDCIRWYT
jgi:hypothetical protein